MEKAFAVLKKIMRGGTSPLALCLFFTLVLFSTSVLSATKTRSLSFAGPSISFSLSSGPALMKVSPVTGSGLTPKKLYCYLQFSGAGSARLQGPDGLCSGIWRGCAADSLGNIPASKNCFFIVPNYAGGSYTVTLVTTTATAPFQIIERSITLNPSSGAASIHDQIKSGSNLVVGHTYCYASFNGKSYALHGKGTFCTSWYGCLTDGSASATPGGIESLQNCWYSVPNIAGGSYPVLLSDSPSVSQSSTFTIITSASITLGPPASGTSNQKIALTGSGLVPGHSYCSITFTLSGITKATPSLHHTGGSCCTATSASSANPGAIPSSLGCYFYVPNLAPTDYLTKLTYGSNTGQATFTILPLSIALTPDQGPGGTRPDVTGTMIANHLYCQVKFGSYTGFVFLHTVGYGASAGCCTSYLGNPCYYEPSGCRTDASGNLPAQCFFVVPNLASGPYPVTLGVSPSSASATFTIGGILMLNPTSGNSGITVAATGKGFDKSSVVKFTWDGNPLSTTTSPITTGISGTFSAKFRVPAGSTGKHTVTAATGSNIGTNTFTILNVPTVWLSPGSGVIGQTVAVYGSALAPGQLITVTFDGTAVALSGNCRVSASGTLTTTSPLCTFKVPAWATSGNNDVEVSDNFNTVPTTFNIDVAEIIPTPDAGYATITSVRLTGDNFVSKYTFTQATFCPSSNPTCGTTVALSGSCTTSITGTLSGPCSFTVPADPPGGYIVGVSDAINSPTYPFTVLSPKLMLTPPQGFVGATITLSGSGFAKSSTIVSVRFGVGPSFAPTGNCNTDSKGTFSTAQGCTFKVPGPNSPGTYIVTATDAKGNVGTASFTIPVAGGGGAYAGPSCGFATVNTGNWISISSLVMLLIIMVAGLVYAVGNFLPGKEREKLKAAANYQLYEALLSLVLIAVLFVSATAACQTGALLVGYNGYTDLFSADSSYVGNLLFLNGFNLVTNMYTTSIQYLIISNIFFYGASQVTGFFGKIGLVTQTVGKEEVNLVTLTFPSSIDDLFSEFSELFTGLYSGLLILTFGGLFILYFFLPIIEAGALSVLLPLTIILRAIPFAGPQIRTTSNAFLALAIGLYFVFPLTIAMNAYVAGCLGINFGGPTSCTFANYPFFASWLSGYSSIAQITSTSASIFTVSNSKTVSSTSLPTDLSGLAIPSTFYGSAFGNIGQIITEMFNSPGVAEQYAYAVSAYVFLGLIMVGIDIAITVGFMAGLAKGLNYFNQLFGEGPFWGGGGG